MWILIVSFVFIVISNEVSSRDMCLHPAGETCREPSTLFDIPRDAEELLSFCPSWIEFLECLNGYDTACSGRSHHTALERPLNYHNLRHILNEFCNERNSHHRSLVLHLPCIRQKIAGKSHTCKKTQDDVQAAYQQFKRFDPERKFSAPASEKDCLRSISYLVCMMDVIGNECGYSAYKEVNKIVTESQMFPFFCGYETAVDLQRILDGMDLESKLKKSLKKYLQV